MIGCNEVQEKIARGDALRGDERDHAAACAACAAMVAEFSLLEVALGTFGSAVPPGFADRVMASLAAEPVVAPRPFARPVQLWLAYAAGAVAVVNVAAFLARVFIATVAFGGTW
jgi:hypothetical protein